MTADLVRLILAIIATAYLPQTGNVAHYGGSWDWSRIAHHHGLVIPAGRLPIATWDCGKLGWVGTLELPGRTYAVFVADCTADKDLESVWGQGIVAEVPLWVAERHGFVGRMARGRIRIAPRVERPVIAMEME